MAEREEGETQKMMQRNHLLTLQAEEVSFTMIQLCLSVSSQLFKARHLGGSASCNYSIGWE